MNLPIGMISAAIAIPLVYGTLRKLFPAAARAPEEASLEDLAAVHRRTEIAGCLVFFFVLWPLCGYAWWLLLVESAQWHTSRITGAILTVPPGGLYWAMVAVLPGGITAAFPADLVVRILVRGRYQEWLRYLELRYGFRQTGKGIVLLLVFLGVPSIVLVLLTLNWYFVLTANDIRLNPWLSGERVYCYDELSEIQMEATAYPESNYVRRAYLFKFNDGYDYLTVPGLIGGRQDKWTEVAEQLSQRSGLPIIETDIPD